ncbi:MAG TPA: sigma 54-interacting transcriptional regulator [Thermoanaerobaculia bacterium]|nr:sigma 54-interacting transcriptional regulator [Thermoanaerobaculia bacterium]
MTAAPLSLPRLARDFPVLAESLRGVERAAATDAPVLILGEAGTGRSTLARAIHDASPRAAGPLVEVDAGAIPSTLFESELFGYRAGAFTGAERASDGRVGRAEGGTLLLDHVEELPLATQPKLLRLVAERRYAPLGDAERTADLRFLAIGSEDLPVRVQRETFRPDLFYRLEVLAFLLPPLRERRRDLPAILDHLLADLAVRFGRPHLQLAPSARAWMLDHSWPGNLRQLRNVLERGLILAGDGSIDPPPPEGTAELRPRPLLDMEKEMIRNALAYTRGHQGKAAELLGISRKALWEKRKRYGIP